MRRVQELLSTDGLLHSIDQDQPPAPAAVALKEKRLTFTWLDGEAQQVSASFCMSVSLLQLIMLFNSHYVLNGLVNGWFVGLRCGTWLFFILLSLCV